MSQQEVYDILKDGEWHCTRHISNIIDKPINTIQTNISKMRSIERKYVNVNGVSNVFVKMREPVR
jgi:hypothetical protein